MQYPEFSEYQLSRASFDGDFQIAEFAQYLADLVDNGVIDHPVEVGVAKQASTKGTEGLSPDQRILSDNQLQNKLKQTRNCTLWALPFYNQIRKIYNLILTHNGGNVKRVIETICLGSDFDGIINPLDYYNNARELNSLQQQLFTLVFENPLDFPGISAQKVVDALMFESAFKFIGKWY